uniref:Uncharacterized protein n=1 Tax=Oryza nivara TaxID=4536 RepID=A0A0E0H4Y3_ORYNI
MAAAGCKVAAASSEDDDSGGGCTLPSARSGVRGGADPAAARQQQRRAEAIQGLELRLRSFYEVENFSSPTTKRGDSLARD